MLESASLDVAQQINQWLIGKLGIDRSSKIKTANS